MAELARLDRRQDRVTIHTDAGSSMIVIAITSPLLGAMHEHRAALRRQFQVAQGPLRHPRLKPAHTSVSVPSGSTSSTSSVTGRASGPALKSTRALSSSDSPREREDVLVRVHGGVLAAAQRRVSSTQPDGSLREVEQVEVPRAPVVPREGAAAVRVGAAGHADFRAVVEARRAGDGHQEEQRLLERRASRPSPGG